MSSSITTSMLEEMRNIDVRTVNKSLLVDINDVKIDTSLPVSERIAEFVRQVHNPYCFRIGDVAVKVVYKENGPSFQQNMEDLFRSL